MATFSPPRFAWWPGFADGVLRTYHAYGTWLSGISWLRFVALSLLLLIVMSILEEAIPSWTTTEIIDGDSPSAVSRPSAPKPPPLPTVRIGRDGIAASSPQGVTISIDRSGVRIVPPAAAPRAVASAASAPASGALGGGVEIRLPPGATSAEVAAAAAEARRAIQSDLEEARRDAEEAQREAEEAVRDAEKALAEIARGRTRIQTHSLGLGELPMNLAFVFIAASAMLKITYKARVQAETRAVQAEETAEAEQLKRQVVEARMAAMQAQVEPHFLFNTLASIDHLIETDPKRASTMQRHLIALLRAAMPTMREASGAGGGRRDLARELAVIRPYLEILKVRMEERLAAEVRIPAGLESAEFPPLMLQGLVENAIKHGLEPKPEGGALVVAAKIEHGKLVVTVADTGLGFGRAATAGTGIGLTNARERLALLYGPAATLAIAENWPSGTVVTITLPYRVAADSSVPRAADPGGGAVGGGGMSAVRSTEVHP